MQSGSRKVPHTFAIAGGKGGIGKSFTSVHLSIALARRGYRTLLVDCDLGGSNLHTCLGIQPPAVSFLDLLDAETPAQAASVVVLTNEPNLRFVSGANDPLHVPLIKPAQRKRAIEQLRSLAGDVLVLDIGAGTSGDRVDFFLHADTGIALTTPEPTAIENAYRFLKAVFYRKLAQTPLNEKAKQYLSDLLYRTGAGKLPTPVQMVAGLRELDPAGAAALMAALDRLDLGLIINQLRIDADRSLGTAMATASRRYFGLTVHNFGEIRYDDLVWQSLRKRMPLYSFRPDAAAVADIERVADRLAGRLTVTSMVDQVEREQRASQPV